MGSAALAHVVVSRQVVNREDYPPFKKDATLSRSVFFVPILTLIWPADFSTSRLVTFSLRVAVMRNNGGLTVVKAPLGPNQASGGTERALEGARIGLPGRLRSRNGVIGPLRRSPILVWGLPPILNLG
jgi:hypothetical protein